MGEQNWITPERRENARNAIALLNIQFSGDDAEAFDSFLADLATDNLSETLEDFAMRLLEGVLDVAQFLVLMRYEELEKAPSETLAELGRMFAEPSDPKSD